MLVSQKRFATVLFLSVTLISLRAAAQQMEPEASATLASGTLNVILGNKSGFVIGTDSRMSSDTPFDCNGKPQLYCDNSQKLFWTTSHSAMSIAGFAVGRWKTHTPLDLELAPVLRRTFGPGGQSADEKSGAIPQIVNAVVEEALTGVAAIYDPRTPSSSLSLTATFARIDSNHEPVFQQMQLIETWIPMGPLKVLAPRYDTQLTRPVPITRFTAVTVGIPFVADAILGGIYKSVDPLILEYYRRRKADQLDDMTLSEMSALVRIVLRETKKFTDYVGGEDQIAEFPSDSDATFHLPKDLPIDAHTIPRLIRWDGLLCMSSQTPPCGNPPLSISFNSAQPPGEVRFTKFLMASEFKDIPVVLDNNLFVADTFEGVTLKWNGGPFFLYRNIFNNCVLELTVNVKADNHPELAVCRIVRKSAVAIPSGTVGLPVQMIPGPPGSINLPRGIGP